MKTAPAPRSTWGRTAALLTPLQLTLRLGEAAFPLVLAAWFGSSPATDVYVFSSALFTFAGALVFSAYRDSALIPILTEARLRRPDSLPRVLGSLLVHTALAATACSLLSGVAAAFWFWMRYGANERALALSMLPLFCGHLVLVTLGFMFIAILHAFHRFLPAPVAAAVAMGTAIAVLAVLRGRLGVRAIPIAQLVGEALAVLVLLAWILGPARLRLRPTLERPAPVRHFGRQMVAHVGGQAIGRLNPVVDQLVAGLLPLTGGATLLKLSNDVAMAPISLLAATLLPVLLSHWSEDVARTQLDRLAETLRRALRITLVALIALTLGLIALRHPLLALVYGRGAMTPAGLAAMSPIFVCQVLGLAPFGALLILSRAHIAAGNTRVLVPLSALNAGANLALDLALMQGLGLTGIALATTLANTVVAVACWRRLPKIYR